MGEEWSHRQRRIAMLRDVPQVRALFGPCRATALFTAIIVACQFGLAWGVAGASWWLVLVLAYAVGAFLAHFLNVVIHECSHNLVFRSTPLNKAMAIFANLPNLLPSAIPFRHYHLLHHRFLGHHGMDADVPSRWEIALVGRGRFGKLMWLLAQPFTYSVINPLAVVRRIPFDRWLIANCIAVVCASTAVGCGLGSGAIIYLALSVYFSVGPHPTGAHILQEHIIFGVRQETYSYYGPVNAISINHGLHVEHHDFPNVAGPRLAKLRDAAHRYYVGQFHHRSRWGTMWRFVTDSNVGLDSRLIKEGRTRQLFPSAER